MSGLPAMLATVREVLGPHSRLAIVFGSAARGTLRADSDVDVGFLPLGPDISLAEELGLQSILEDRFARPVDLVRLDRCDAILAWRVARDGIVAWSSPAYEAPRFRARAALTYADLEPLLEDAGERYRRWLERSA